MTSIPRVALTTTRCLKIKLEKSIIIHICYRSSILLSIGLYRENAIAIESEARDPFGGNVYYVTMQITFPIPEFAGNERNLHCYVVHVTTEWVSRLVLDHAIVVIQTSR